MCLGGQSCCLTTRSSGPGNNVGRVWPRHDHRARSLNLVVRQPAKVHHEDDEDLAYGEAVTMAGVRKRSEVTKLLPDDSRKALSVARSIKHPWYRTQALSNVAQFKSGGEALAILEEAFAAASEQAEINRIVTVSSWPLRELVKIDAKRAQRHLERLLALATQEPHGLRRADALSAMLGVVFSTRAQSACCAATRSNTAIWAWMAY